MSLLLGRPLRLVVVVGQGEDVSADVAVSVTVTSCKGWPVALTESRVEVQTCGAHMASVDSVSTL